MDEKVYQAALNTLNEDGSGELEDLLARIISHEKSRPENDPYQGSWEWYMVHGDARTLNKLVTRQVLCVTMKTNKSCYYKAGDIPALERALKDYKLMVRAEQEPAKIPDDLLDVVIGHEDKKEIITRSLTSAQPVSLLLWGSVASAKSLIIEELSRLPNSKMVLGSSMTKAGLYEVLFSEKPTYLLVDEIDKIDDSDNLTCLLSLMERGRISETKFNRQRELKLRTWVFATANRVDALPVELKSRFLLLRFREYTDQEYLDVVEKVLTTRENIPSTTALRIGNQVIMHLGSRDVRDAVKVCRLLKERTPEEINHVIDILRKQK